MIAGVIAGVIAGSTLVGTAFAAPRVLTAAANNGYGMMRSLETSTTFVRPTLEQMTAFMNAYRNADGSIDVTRMHNDVATGQVTPPHMSRTPRAGGTVQRPTGPASSRGYGMMGSPRTGSGVPSAGYGMMGSSY